MTGMAWLIPPLTLILGWLVWSRLPPAADEQDDPLERGGAAIVAGVLLTGCVALLLAELHVLKPWVLASGLVLVSAATWAMPRRLPAAERVSRTDAAAFAFVLLFAAGTLAPASEQITGGRDEGVYANIGAWIAQRGTVRIHSEALASLADESRPIFQSRVLLPGFQIGDAARGEVFAQFMHLHPVYLALGFWLGGLTGLLFVPPAYGVLSAAATFLFVRRLLGAGPAVIAVLVLGLNLAHIWVLRTPFSEGPAQFAFMASLWSLARASVTGGMRWGILAGLAMGAGFLLRVDSLLLLVGLLPALAVVQSSSTRADSWATGIVLPLTLVFGVWGFVHGYIFAAPYMALMSAHTTPLWVLSALLLALFLVWRALGSQRRRAAFELVYRQGRWWWALAALLVCAAFVTGFWIRPRLGPIMAAGRRVYVEESMVRTAWYVSTAGMVTACAGIVILLRRWLVDRRAEWVPFLSIALAISFAYFWHPRVHHDHPWTMRRFVPVVLPAIAIAIAAASAWLWRARGPWRHAARAAAVLVVGTILVHEARLTRPFWKAREQAGAMSQLRDIARHLPPGSLLLYTGGRASWVATPLSLVWQHDTLPIVRNATLDRDGEAGRPHFEAQVSRWLRDGHDVVYLTQHDAYTPYLTHELRLLPIASFRFRTEGAGQHFTRPPRTPQVRDDTFHLLQFARPPDVAPDCASLSFDAAEPVAGRAQGFHAVESGQDEPYRWAEPLSRVLFPVCDRRAGGPTALVVRAACSRARRTAPCQVHVTINGMPAGELALTRRWADHVLPVPAAAVTQRQAPIDVRFSGPSFPPAGGRERRTLSFKLRRVALQREITTARGVHGGG